MVALHDKLDVRAVAQVAGGAGFIASVSLVYIWKLFVAKSSLKVPPAFPVSIEPEFGETRALSSR